MVHNLNCKHLEASVCEQYWIKVLCEGITLILKLEFDRIFNKIPSQARLESK